MIISITANTTFDQTVFISAFEKNTTIRAQKTVQGLGGKPSDAAWILGTMGIPSVALGFAAGAIGHKLESMLKERNVTPDFDWVDGDTRMNTVIVSDEGWQTTITTDTLQIRPEHIDALRTRYIAALDSATVVILGGSLPKNIDPALYVDLITLARERNIPVAFDADEPNLSVGLQARPTYIKPNRDELSRLAKKPIDSVETAYQIGREIVETYGTCPIITLGEEGALAVLQDRAYRIPALPVDVVSTAGAGDGVLAGMSYSLHLGLPPEDGLRMGVAMASAVLLQPGTADCRREDVERFLPQVELIPYP